MNHEERNVNQQGSSAGESQEPIEGAGDESPGLPLFDLRRMYMDLVRGLLAVVTPSGVTDISREQQKQRRFSHDLRSRL